jgi:hypothetical protein
VAVYVELLLLTLSTMNIKNEVYDDVCLNVDYPLREELGDFLLGCVSSAAYNSAWYSLWESLRDPTISPQSCTDDVVGEYEY